MYPKQVTSRMRQEFWTVFGQYMQPVLSADGERVNWINYKTGEKGIAFRMDADTRQASISIELSHKDPGLRQLYFEQFRELEKLLHLELGEIWDWEPQYGGGDGRVVSRIYKTLDGVNLFQKEDWPTLISFFKPRIIALDGFWSAARYSFEALR
jgi:hypothetical protein